MSNVGALIDQFVIDEYFVPLNDHFEGPGQFNVAASELNLLKLKQISGKSLSQIAGQTTQIQWRRISSGRLPWEDLTDESKKQTLCGVLIDYNIQPNRYPSYQNGQPNPWDRPSAQITRVLPIFADLALKNPWAIDFGTVADPQNYPGERFRAITTYRFAPISADQQMTTPSGQCANQMQVDRAILVPSNIITKARGGSFYRPHNSGGLTTVHTQKTSEPFLHQPNEAAFTQGMPPVAVWIDSLQEYDYQKHYNLCCQLAELRGFDSDPIKNAVSLQRVFTNLYRLD